MTAERRNYRTETTEEVEVERSEKSEGTKAKVGQRQQNDNVAQKVEYINITGFFPARSGKADTVFITEKICDDFQRLRPGDVLGVSVNQKTNRLSLWAIPKYEGDTA